jgi:hypothetical protein
LLSTDGQALISYIFWQSSGKLNYYLDENISYVPRYFIDRDWNYREILIDFTEIEGQYTGKILCEIILKSLADAGIDVKIVHCATTDNAKDQQKMAKELDVAVKIFSKELQIYRVPCLAHIIQLAVKAFLKSLKITAKNEEVSTFWTKKIEKRSAHTKKSTSPGSVANTLRKVRSFVLTTVIACSNLFYLGSEPYYLCERLLTASEAIPCNSVTSASTQSSSGCSKSLERNISYVVSYGRPYGRYPHMD